VWCALMLDVYAYDRSWWLALVASWLCVGGCVVRCSRARFAVHRRRVEIDFAVWIGRAWEKVILFDPVWDSPPHLDFRPASARHSLLSRLGK